MTRYAMGVEYDGGGFSGWQIQNNGRSVQADLEKALSRIAAEPIKVICSGRTDTGVHAINQVIHFDTDAQRNERSWLLGTNTNLPDDVNVHWVKSVSEQFSARFDAFKRHYRYLIYNQPLRSSLYHQRMTWVYRPLDHQVMHEAAQALVGEHDFTSFRARRCQAKHPIRQLYELNVRRQGKFIIIDVRANAFLYHMVRNIVAALIEIGRGDKPSEWMTDVLALRDRSKASVTAPAAGLYFVSPYYPEEYEIPVFDGSQAFPL